MVVELFFRVLVEEMDNVSIVPPREDPRIGNRFWEESLWPIGAEVSGPGLLAVPSQAMNEDDARGFG